MEPGHHVTGVSQRHAEMLGRRAGGHLERGLCFRSPSPLETALLGVTFLSGTRKGKAIKANGYAVYSEGTLSL